MWSNLNLATITAMPVKGAAVLLEEAFMDAEGGLVALPPTMQERVTSLGLPRSNGEPASEAARAELKRIKADLCHAKQLLLDMEMSALSIAEPTRRRDLGARI